MFCASHLKPHDSSQAYLANTLVAVANIRRLHVANHSLPKASDVLKLNDETGSEDARRKHKTQHTSAQDCLDKAREIGHD